MRSIILLLALAVVAGCNNEGMSNDEIIKTAKRCKEAGLDMEVILVSGRTNIPISGRGTGTVIVCKPKLTPVAEQKPITFESAVKRTEW